MRRTLMLPAGTAAIALALLGSAAQAQYDVRNGRPRVAPTPSAPATVGRVSRRIGTRLETRLNTRIQGVPSSAESQKLIARPPTPSASTTFNTASPGR